MNEVVVMNPLTKRLVNVGSKKYRELVQQGVIVPKEQPLPQVQRVVERKQVQNLKPCAEGKVRNPQTGYCIQKNGALYKKLKAQGVQFFDDDLVPVPQLVAPNPVPAKKKCKNHDTFLYQTDMSEIPEDDLLILPSGYCFSISEILDWIKSGTFQNMDPYLTGETLFSEGNKPVWNIKELGPAIQAYFESQQKERQNAYKLIYDHLDMLYLIADTGRICYYDNLSSTEAKDSSEFEYSISALATLQEKLQALPKNVRDALTNLRFNNATVGDTVKQANEGTLCIHGVGINLIKIFITNFLNMEKAYPKLVYDPLKSGLYFVEEKKGVLIMYNSEIRFIADPTREYYVTYIRPITLEIYKNIKSSLIWGKKKMNQEGLSEIYTKKCPNEAYLSSLDTNDEWSEIPNWRKMRLEDGYCFDLLFLIITVTSQLNTTKNVNPYPIYPTNIFTNKPLTMGDLIQLRRRIVNNYLKVAPCLLLFLYNAEKVWSNDTEYTKSHAWRDACITLFERDLRYRRYLYERQGEDPIIHGIWVAKTEGMTQDERNIVQFLSTADPMYIQRVSIWKIPNTYYFINNLITINLQHAFGDAKALQ